MKAWSLPHTSHRPRLGLLVFCGCLVSLATLSARGADFQFDGDTQAASSAAGVGPCGAGDYCGGCNVCGPSWTFRADALLLDRSRADALPLVFEDNGLGEPGDELLNVRDLDLGVAGGPRLALIRHLTPCYSVELNYLGIDGWTARESRTGDFAQAVGSITPIAGTASFAYGSELYSAEANIRRNTNSWLTLLAGFRWLRLHEDFIANYDVGGPQQYMIDTDNHLYGVQVGAEALMYQTGSGVRVDGWGKAGIFGNSADQSTVDENVGATGASDSSSAFVGELGLGGVYPVTDRLFVRGGYQMLWVEGVALAPNQIAESDLTLVPPVGGIDTSGGVFYHGAYVGLESTW